MTFPDDGETIGLFEPLMVSEGSPTRAGLNDLVLELAEKSAAFRSSLPASANYRGRTVDVDGLSGFKCPACGEIEFDTEKAERYAAASDALVLAKRRAARDELRHIPAKPNQPEASRLTFQWQVGVPLSVNSPITLTRTSVPVSIS